MRKPNGGYKGIVSWPLSTVLYTGVTGVATIVTPILSF